MTLVRDKTVTGVATHRPDTGHVASPSPLMGSSQVCGLDWVSVDPPAFDLTGRRILVVDDEEYITDLLGTALRFVGCDVRVATTGQEALAHVADFSPEMILLDVMMPPPDGFEVARRLRSDGLGTPVIFL